MANASKARVFMSGRSQHVTIPVGFRFRSSEVSIRRDPNSGDVILSEVPNLAEVFAALDAATLPDDFMSEADRDRRPAEDRPGLNQLFEDGSIEGKNRQ
ncbi:MAG: AbrB family transcriptional regulator [Terracidiphilus sp.]|nr:AbrB family transcriptional regulator [Terracidiphilus sp.]